MSHRSMSSNPNIQFFTTQTDKGVEVWMHFLSKAGKWGYWKERVEVFLYSECNLIIRTQVGSDWVETILTAQDRADAYLIYLCEPFPKVPPMHSFVKEPPPDMQPRPKTIVETGTAFAKEVESGGGYAWNVTGRGVPIELDVVPKAKLP